MTTVLKKDLNDIFNAICTTYLGIGEATFWEEKKVRLPVPVESTLECMYGKNWRHPFPQYRWNLDPFLTGYCQY